ncbi:hypothetical protein BC828DRAFT_394212 [Blastocladiella britannica]|nr:hypothetical protein BC828DRAFT_394212 [Blastocladiella britannica]
MRRWLSVLLLAIAVPVLVTAHNGMDDEEEESNDPWTPLPCDAPKDYSISLQFHPAPAPDDHKTRLSFKLWNHLQDRAVRWDELWKVHDRRAHIMLASKDGGNVQWFGHIHPEDFVDPGYNMPLSLGPYETKLVAEFDLRDSAAWNVHLEAAVRVELQCLVPLSSSSPHHLARRHGGGGHGGPEQFTPVKHIGGAYVPDGWQLVERSSPTVAFSGQFTIDFTDVEPFTNTPSSSLLAAAASSSLTVPVTVGSVSAVQVPLTRTTDPIDLLGTSPSSSTEDGLIKVLSPQLEVAARSPLPTVRVGKCRTLLFHYSALTSSTTEQKQQPITDLSLWLGAVSHVAAIHRESGAMTHMHGATVSNHDVTAAFAHRPADREHWELVGASAGGDGVLFGGTSGRTHHASSSTTQTPAFDQCASGMPHHSDANLMLEQPWIQFGPWIAVPVTLPRAGWWKLVVQTQRGDRVLVASYWVLAGK